EALRALSSHARFPREKAASFLHCPSLFHHYVWSRQTRPPVARAGSCVPRNSSCCVRSLDATGDYLRHENRQKTAVPGEMPPALCPGRRWGYLQASAQDCKPHPDAVAPAARNAQASPPVLPFLSAAEAFAFS